MKGQESSPHDARRGSAGSSHVSTCRTSGDQSHGSQRGKDQSKDTSEHQFEPSGEKRSSLEAAESNISERQPDQKGTENTPLPAATQINISQPIRSLCGVVKVGLRAPLTVTGEIEPITDEEILKDREPEEVIRSIPRFRNYQPGKPSKVPTASAAIKCLLPWYPGDVNQNYIFSHSQQHTCGASLLPLSRRRCCV